ncbi:MAG: phosphatidylserine decarboxylase [Acidobacteria bacterium]|nr:phosphatidylserine decarboxylase [Acidobacteriota bacterium]
MRIASDAYRFLIPLLLSVALLVYFSWLWLAGLAAIFFIFVLFFFRDPEREIPSSPGLIVSPADGKVVRIDFGNGKLPIQVSIFLSVFDVHINRAPVEGRVAAVEHRNGKFRAAFNELASVENEQTVIDLDEGRHSVRMALIAGLIARRVVCWVRPGDQMRKGQRIGLIRFGSRVDLFLPGLVRLEVKKGDRVRGGASIIGKFTD